MINKRPYYLIDDIRADRSGWDIDNRGAGTVYGGGWITKSVKNIGNGFATTFTRPVTVQTSGTVTLELNFKIESGNGFYIGLFDEKMPIVLLKQNGSKMFDSNGSEIFTLGDGVCWIKLTVDLDNKKTKLFCNGKITDIAPCFAAGRALHSLKFGYCPNDVGQTFVSTRTKLYKNYIFNDECVCMNAGAGISDEYDTDSAGISEKYVKEYYSSTKSNVYCIENLYDGESWVEKNFNAKCGFEFRVKYLAMEDESTVSICFCSDKTSVFEVNDTKNAIFCRGEKISHHKPLVWQSLRIVADIKGSKALIYHNTREVFSICINPKLQIDSIKIKFEAKNNSKMLFTDFRIFDYDSNYEDDYVPAPVKPKKTSDCQIGINICSLWRGDHIGWDCITPFPEIKPLLGYYDEDIPETADWEIKWMAEHGIDFELYCWYATESDIPFVDTLHYWQLDEAHRYARYSSEVKFALLWEAQCAKCPSNFESFKKYYVPYWIDHYFSDSQYYTIDGYAFMSIYEPSKFISAMGGADGTKTALEYLRNEVTKLGYKGLIVTVCETSNAKLYSECGFDAFQAYNWSREGFDLDFTKEQICKSINNPYGLHFIPTVSTGFSSIGWHGVRFPNISVENLRESLIYCRDEILSKIDVRAEDGWKKKLVMLSTWNEYGEGTYMMPAGLNGFGYLDAVKDVFAAGSHNDTIPTESQLSRINILHPTDRKTIAPLGYVKPQMPVPSGGLIREYVFKDDNDISFWKFHNIDRVEIRNGVLCGYSDKSNPYMVLKDDSFLPIAANRLSGVSVTARSWREGNCPDCIQLFLSNRKDGAFLTMRNAGFVTNPSKAAKYSAKFGNLTRRQESSATYGTIYSFRIDPVFAQGYFEIEKIEFEEAMPVMTLFIDGEASDLLLPIVKKDGDILIPFDTVGNVSKRKELYWKWEEKSQSLYLYGIKDAVFTVGNDSVLLDGKKVKLKHKTELFDGVPLIPVELYAEILGKMFENNNNTISIC